MSRWPSAILGHRRLSIFDLSDAGSQPMLSDDGEVGVVFNGAVFNFIALREELQGFGRKFRSNCDTEVLVHGYQQWGLDELISRIRGMFAIAIWDNRRQTLSLVRDRLGVKPLIYAARNGQIAFASTVTALQQAGLAGDLDPAAVMEFLEFGFVTDDRAIFEGIHKVHAGTIVEWRAGVTSTRTYWQVADPDDSLKISFDEAVEETERLLVESVKLRLEADVPVGALLSGGVDSGLVCWAMAKLNADITAFTVGAPGDPADETADAVHTAQLLGIPHRVVELTAGDAASIDDLISAYGEPFGCSSALGMLQVSRAVKPHATVLLTGDGGDDVFLGYPFHKHFWTAQRVARSLPGFASPLWRAVRPIAVADSLRRPRHFLDYATGGLGAITRVHDGLPYYQRFGLLGERLASRTLPQRQIPLTDTPATNVLSDFLAYEQKTRFVGEFMTKVDGGTMHYAIEARSPLLDQKIWEFLPARLPSSLPPAQWRAEGNPAGRFPAGGSARLSLQGESRVSLSRCNAGWRVDGAVASRTSHTILFSKKRAGCVQVLFRTRKKVPPATQLWYLVVLENWMRRQRTL